MSEPLELKKAKIDSLVVSLLMVDINQLIE